MTTPNPSEYRIRRNHRAEQEAADRPWWRRVLAAAAGALWVRAVRGVR